MFGGSAEYNNYGMSRSRQLLITFNGPLFESLLIALSYFLLKSEIFASHYYMQYALHVTMHLNILWCLLNLIPIEPLDGGKLLRGVLEAALGEKGLRISLILGLVSVTMIAPYLFLKGYYFFGMLTTYFGFQGFQKLRGMSPESHERNHFSEFMRGIEAANTNNLEEAKQIFQRLVKSKQTNIKYPSIESLAKIYFQQNEGHKSYQLLLNTDHQSLKEGKCLLCHLAFERKNYELVAKYSRDIYAIEPTYDIALLNSKSFACMNQPILAAAWLNTASQFGVEYKEKVKEVFQQAVYDSVRHHEAFIKLV
jgi:hypothetical protein